MEVHRPGSPVTAVGNFPSQRSARIWRMQALAVLSDPQAGSVPREADTPVYLPLRHRRRVGQARTKVAFSVLEPLAVLSALPIVTRLFPRLMAKSRYPRRDRLLNLGAALKANPGHGLMHVELHWRALAAKSATRPVLMTALTQRRPTTTVDHAASNC